MQNSTQSHIVIAGSGELSIAAYQSLSRRLAKSIKCGKTRISIISSGGQFECNALVGEIISGRIDHSTASMPLQRLAPHADIIKGNIQTIRSKRKTIDVLKENGQIGEIAYDHLILDHDCWSEDIQNAQNKHVMTLGNIKDATSVCARVDMQVKKAATIRNPLQAKNILSFVFLANSMKDLSLASFIQQHINDCCSRYYSLLEIKPVCTVVMTTEEHVSALSEKDSKIFAGVLDRSRLDWIKDDCLDRITPEGVVLTNGCFIAAGMVIQVKQPAAQKTPHAFSLHQNGRILTDIFLRVKGESHIWSGAGCSQLTHPTSQANTCSRQGRHIAQNIILAMECRFLKAYTSSMVKYNGMLFNDHGLSKIAGRFIKGRLAWYIHLFYLLGSLPSAKMRNNGFINLVSHFIWRKTKQQSGIKHYKMVSANKMRVAS